MSIVCIYLGLKGTAVIVSLHRLYAGWYWKCSICANMPRMATGNPEDGRGEGEKRGRAGND